ncbi:MAG: amidase [Candidatus Tectomicrobia bacterium]|uniref:Amidase n=1 Tax=Tectimicrobiota bacterium TaxID=2528274 RepID=A0A938B1P7_UNCTE|nr:amidase [Candidatus Tectomicrobia bacterium]
MADTPLHFYTIAELAALFKGQHLSPVEVTQSMLRRIEQLDGRLQSYATVMAEQALAAATRAEREIQAGVYRGALHGVPIAVKDLCYTRGVRTMGGTKALAGHMPRFDATVVARLEAAGAVLLGKLHLTEGAMGGYNPDFAIPVNPWHPERYTGASSSGSGVATAAGLCFGSLGSDTGGSIRFPAAACGIVGLKPTWGRVSRYGVLALAESLDHVGPMTRSTLDAAIMLHAIAGADPCDPTTLCTPIPDLVGTIATGIQGVRVGFDEHYVSHDVDPEVAEAVVAGVHALESLGAVVVPVRLPDLEPYLEAWPILCTAEAAAAHAATYPAQREAYGPWFRGWLDLGLGVSGVAYARANNLRAACNSLLQRVWQSIDVLACPAMPTPAFPVTPAGLYGPMSTRGFDMSRLRFTAPYNFNGAPTLTVPCGINREGLPLSLQFVGSTCSEALLCRLGYAYEQATPWHHLRPPV